MLYSVHIIKPTPFQRWWLLVLRKFNNRYAYNEEEFTSLDQAKEYAQQVAWHTGCDVVIIEDYDIQRDWEDPDYAPVIHRLPQAPINQNTDNLRW